jgi:hypothetical protein
MRREAGTVGPRVEVTFDGDRGPTASSRVGFQVAKGMPDEDGVITAHPGIEGSADLTPETHGSDGPVGLFIIRRGSAADVVY